MKSNYKVLFYGTGVIGSVYAVKLSKAGHDVSVYARGSRLLILKSKGLLYSENNSVARASVKVLDNLDLAELFDYIFVPIRYNQIETALSELAANKSHNIVTMANNPNGYEKWESLVGKGRLIPAFAGAGGKIEDDILHFKFTPRILQPTTFGEIDGTITDRIRGLAEIFKSCKIPYSISKNMDAWQKSHIALVVPLANAIYFDGGDNFTTAKNNEAIKLMGAELKKSFNAIKAIGIHITPSKLSIFRVFPLWFVKLGLKFFCNTKLAGAISSHVPYIKEEMLLLEKDFNTLVNTKI